MQRYLKRTGPDGEPVLISDDESKVEEETDYGRTCVVDGEVDGHGGRSRCGEVMMNPEAGRIICEMWSEGLGAWELIGNR